MDEVKTTDTFKYLWSFSWTLLGMSPVKNYKGLYKIYSACVTIIILVIQPLSVIAYLFVASDLQSLLNNVTIGLGLISTAIKQCAVWVYKNDLLNTVPYFNNLDTRVNRNDGEKEYLTKTVRSWTRIYFFFTITYLLALVLMLASALVAAENRLLFYAWFPFDYEDKYYYYALGYQMLSGCISDVQNSSTEYYSISYISLLSAHVKMLSMRISRIGYEDSVNHENNYKELIACIKDHKTIIKVQELISPVISRTTLIQFLVQSFVICINLVKATFVDGNASEVVFSIYYTLIVVSSIFPICICGSRLTDETSKLTTAMFKCNWMEQSPKFKKTLIIFMTRSQKHSIIFAGNLFRIQIATGLEISRFSFSLFTLMNKMK